MEVDSDNNNYKKTYQNIQVMRQQLLIFFLITLLTFVTPKCTNQLPCFKNKLFNFGSPGQSIYILSDITNTKQQSNLNILAYGDFDNDLHTDFIAQNINNTAQLSIYSWDSQHQIFALNATLNSEQCIPSSVFLYDINLDGLLDIVAWGINGSLNCILPFIHQNNGTFTVGNQWQIQKTANPFVISYVNDGQRINGLVLFQNGTRVILKYDSSVQTFLQINWTNIFISTNSFETTPFADPHWNSYLDLTGDCQSDVIIVDNNNNIQVWINKGGNKFQYLQTYKLGDIASLSFADMNYDGVIDLVLAYPTYIKVVYNKVQLKMQTDFCVPQYTNVAFNFNNTISYNLPQGYTFLKNTLQIKDINIDGFPDLLLILAETANNNNSIIKIVLNSRGEEFYENQQYVLPAKPIQEQKNTQEGQQYQVKFTNVISASFIDFWENGILDIIVCTKQGMISYYNNYLQQNLFFIKGYGASGQSTSKGAQLIGASFYWVNSVGDGYRTTYQPQILQTAYNALQTPYSYCGLGRANNYVQSFTLGIYGMSNSWTPIIPNSQLAVYAQSTDPKQWAIRIYVLPTQSLVYVIIVSIFVLTVLGIVLVILKCKNHRKKEQPLMEFIH